MLAFGRPVVQLAFHVADIEAAAADCARRFGWGPFFIAHHVPLARCTWRGAASTFDHGSAYGQAGTHMVELIQQYDDRPSVLRERFAQDATGLHHMAMFVDDLDVFLGEAAQAGCPTALDAETASGVRFVMVDAVPTLGCFVEAYVGSDFLRGFYDMVRKAAEGWTGEKPVRRVG